ncbi:MAG: sugar transferase [Candidatus Shapirobacteria bacterium]|jgi:lipopolysaccharide/colanic/teichoic acid biosynthesis glycosyltransferase
MTRRDLPFYNLRVFLFAPVKRTIDIFASALLLIAFSPILLIVSLLIKITSFGPIIFKQKRVGQDREFFMYKFRSMRCGDNDKFLRENYPELWEKYKANDWKLSASEDPRITKIGKFIRATSIDEMPQFINVLKGEMSLVGPRAYRDEELNEYAQKYPKTKKYIDIIRTAKPGITGLWQVSGRNNLPFEKRAKMDAVYIKNRSLRQEIAIIFKTPAAMFSNW